MNSARQTPTSNDCAGKTLLVGDVAEAFVDGADAEISGCAVYANILDAIEAAAKGESAAPTFRDALETQKVCDAVLDSAKTGLWTNVG